MKNESPKIEKNAKVSLVFIILGIIVFILTGIYAERAYKNHGIEDAIIYALPGGVLSLGGIITSLVLAIKSLKKINDSEGKLIGKRLVYAIIAADCLLLLMMFV